MLNYAFGLQLKNGFLVDVFRVIALHIFNYLQHSLLIDLPIENMTQVTIFPDGHGGVINFREIFF